jgi:hypothetical protein
MPIAGSPTLSDVKSPTLAVHCALCRRRSDYRVLPLIDERGDIRLIDALVQLTSGCERRRSAGIYEQCHAMLEDGSAELTRAGNPRDAA